MLRIKEFYTYHLGPIDLNVEPGECCGLTGPSGEGKSLFLRGISDLSLWHGRVTLNGIDSQDISGCEWRKKAAYIPAESAWWFDTVGPHFYAAPAVEDVAELGLSVDVMAWPVTRLSSGEKQRLAILRALSVGPEALLLDEPTAHLDEVNAERVEQFVHKRMTDGMLPVLWVTHNQQQLRRVASNCWSLEGGKLRSMAV